MTEHLTIDQVQSLVERDDLLKTDLVVARRDLTLESGRLMLPPDPERGYSVLDPTTWATGQLTTRLGIPTAFYRRLPAVLQDQLFNFFIAQGQKNEEDDTSKEERWLLRTQGAALRGVLSERYRKFDNADLLAALTAAVPPHLRIVACDLTEMSLHLRMIDPTAVRAARKGDDLMAGIHVANSEVGYRSVTISLIIYRLVCSNGLIKMVDQQHLLHQRHCFVAGDQFNRSIAAAIQTATLAASIALEQFIGTTSWILPNMERSVKYLAAHWGLSQSMQEAIVSALYREERQYQESGYGLINAITSVAQQQSPDSRYDMERLAGSLLDNGSLRALITNPPIPPTGGVSGASRRQTLSPAVAADEFSLPASLRPSDNRNLVRIA